MNKVLFSKYSIIFKALVPFPETNIATLQITILIYQKYKNYFNNKHNIINNTNLYSLVLYLKSILICSIIKKH